ncbi:PadR family transcriptional regulator [Nocardioides acrostichi]|uniref:Helix-turn-helix transcriptional regulator n=1 Tax=Nocardioides acrostichi TaxID=2784339 RepID=A0A930Y8T4_9ACTN|nr:PadR family transcriptional regulator [Nocardioides acrostichi]MBF4163447.1 helix-turn-helix transcriptional regulator [Nocardioides acrostichi]
MRPERDDHREHREPRGDKRGRGRHGGRRGRAPRGDVRSALLLLLAEEPMHGYELMHLVADRTRGAWTPSPGTIYPTLGDLEREGLVTMSDTSGRRVATLTPEGVDAVGVLRETGQDPFVRHERDESLGSLRSQLEQVHSAVREVGRNGTDAQRQAAVEILSTARRSIYLVLADEPVEGVDLVAADRDET